MNRLIIVGNGFDLAHGIKTGYNDFMLWYLKRSYGEAYEANIYEDDAIVINSDPGHKLSNTNMNALIDSFYCSGRMGELTNNKTLRTTGQNDITNPFITTFKSPFIMSIVNNCSSTNWVVIENEYYQALKELIRNPSNRHSDVVKLNDSLKEVIKQLSEYLLGASIPTSSLNYFSILDSQIDARDVVTLEVETHKPTETMVLNFNYTPTIETYVNNESTNINYIHGKLGDTDNPVIFGYGDELDEDYAGFETKLIKGIFKYIKSFWYFRTRNYHNLIRFIQKDNYQVVILGHSCGLSDRTMLNMIFDDPNCKSVKIYHYVKDGKDNYTELTYDLARHFKNKAEMRKKIVPFDRASFMPQAGIC
jgi:hypothetical protein